MWEALFPSKYSSPSKKRHSSTHTRKSKSSQNTRERHKSCDVDPERHKELHKELVQLKRHSILDEIGIPRFERKLSNLDDQNDKDQTTRIPDEKRACKTLPLRKETTEKEPVAQGDKVVKEAGAQREKIGKDVSRDELPPELHKEGEGLSQLLLKEIEDQRKINLLRKQLGRLGDRRHELREILWRRLEAARDARDCPVVFAAWKKFAAATKLAKANQLKSEKAKQPANLQQQQTAGQGVDEKAKQPANLQQQQQTAGQGVDEERQDSHNPQIQDAQPPDQPALSTVISGPPLVLVGSSGVAVEESGSPEVSERSDAEVQPSTRKPPMTWIERRASLREAGASNPCRKRHLNVEPHQEADVGRSTSLIAAPNSPKFDSPTEVRGYERRANRTAKNDRSCPAETSSPHSPNEPKIWETSPNASVSSNKCGPNPANPNAWEGDEAPSVHDSSSGHPRGIPEQEKSQRRMSDPSSLFSQPASIRKGQSLQFEPPCRQAADDGFQANVSEGHPRSQRNSITMAADMAAAAAAAAASAAWTPEMERQAALEALGAAAQGARIERKARRSVTMPHPGYQPKNHRQS